MVNYFKKISIRNELEVSFDADLAPLAPFRGARLLHHNLGSPASTGELKFIRKIMRAIREALLGRKRKKNELAQIIGLSFGFDNTRIYVKGEKNHSHLLGEFSRGEFRKSSSYENGSKGRNKIFPVLEEMSKNGQYILRFDLRYALFLWEDDPEVKRLIEKLKLKRDEEQISLMRKISPNKTDVLEDINYYLLYNEFHRSKGNDISNIPMEMIFVALINGDKQIHGYIMANNFITGTPLMVDEDTLRETSEVILDTYKIYKSMEEEKERATRAEHELMIKNMELQEIAIKDALTGLFTKRYFQEVFPLELERAKREETNVGITFFDIDHFKDVNDEYGHEVGDMVLANVAAIIKEECRKSDIPCRFGGEEIVIISNDIENVLQVIALAKRIREKINNFVFEIQKHGQLPIKFQITVSIGIAIGSAKVILTDADDAMYYSKKHGRNKVVVKDPEKAKMQPLMLPILSEDHEFIVFIE